MRTWLTILALVAIGVISSASGIAQSVRPSATALETTAYRAIGAKHPDPAIRNADVLAERMLGTEERAILKETGSAVVLEAIAMDTERAWTSLGNRSVFARGVHVRTRHIDEVLVDSLKAGNTQVVILGAGLDSRAYRFADALKGARVFELDLPQTQEYKKARVRSVLGALPSHVTYSPIDFTKQDLATVLAASGYDRTKKSIFIWEGVTMYIPEAGIDATLRALAGNTAKGSRLVFDYFTEQALKNLPPALREVSRNVATVGEPFVFGMPGGRAAPFVTARGYSVVSDFGSDDLGARFLPKAHAMPTPAANRLCVAEVR
jgi:methyltransferase (TIGR00027 family)